MRLQTAKEIVSIFCAVSIAFFYTPGALSQTTIMLRDGKTVTGELVEETDAYIKLDIHGVTVTYFKEQFIKRITTGEEALSAMSPADIYQSYLAAMKRGSWQSIRMYLSEDNIRQLEAQGNIEQSLNVLRTFMPQHAIIVDERAQGAAAILIVEGQTLFGTTRGAVFFVKEGGIWKIQQEDYRGLTPHISEDTPAAQGVPAVTGSISGTVLLPAEDATGNLFITFVDMQTGVHYDRGIPPQALTTGIVSFFIDGVVPGTYSGSATWDIAEPQCELSAKGCPGFDGDYIGATKKTIFVPEGGSIAGIRIECTRLSGTSSTGD